MVRKRMIVLAAAAFIGGMSFTPSNDAMITMAPSVGVIVSRVRKTRMVRITQEK